MKGLYTAGVMDVMLEKRWMPDVICGTSAGVTFGVNLPSQQRGRVLRYNKRFAKDPRYISVRSLLTTGDMVNYEFSYHLLPEILDPFDEAEFERSGVDFYATITNVRTGKAEYVLLKNVMEQMEVVRASASLPFVSRKVRVGDEWYLDGGIADNIPIRKALEVGCEKVVVVLTHPAGYVRKEKMTVLAKIFYPRDKELQQAFERRNEEYMNCIRYIEQLENEGKVKVLRPSKFVKIGRLEADVEKLQALYDVGVKDAEKKWDEIMQWLNE